MKLTRKTVTSIIITVFTCARLAKRKQAIQHFHDALEDPFYSTPSIAMTNAGSCALRSGNLDEADEYLRAALKIEPDLPDALMNMARLSFERKDLPEGTGVHAKI